EDRGARSPFLLKVFFGGLMSKEVLAAHIERKRAEVVHELEEYREIEWRIRDDPQSYFGYVTLRWGLTQARAWIRWADEILRELGERRRRRRSPSSLRRWSRCRLRRRTATPPPAARSPPS